MNSSYGRLVASYADSFPPSGALESYEQYRERSRFIFELPQHAKEEPRPAQDDYDPPPRIVCPTIFLGRQPPPRRWIVRDWIPHGAVTALYGAGGLGKSLLVQQLQTSTAIGTIWLGLPVEQIVSLGLYCEDGENELWRRQCEINADYGIDHNALASAHWMPRLGEDNILLAFTRKGTGELTKLHRQLVEAAMDLGARLIVIDGASDAFGGDENNRGQVRQFIQRALGQIALKIDGAVLCIAHPSRTGMSTGTGDSGSTGWSAAFRSRLFMREAETEHGEPPDPNIRILERKKANYASRGDLLRLRWHNGVIIPDGINAPGMTAAGQLEAKDVFLDLLREFTDQKRPVSSKSRAGNYAPREFEKLPSDQRLGFQRRDFEKAMNVLFKAKKIANAEYGRKGDERTMIVVCGDSEHAR